MEIKTRNQIKTQGCDNTNQSFQQIQNLMYLSQNIELIRNEDSYLFFQSTEDDIDNCQEIHIFFQNKILDQIQQILSDFRSNDAILFISKNSRKFIQTLANLRSTSQHHLKDYVNKILEIFSHFFNENGLKIEISSIIKETLNQMIKQKAFPNIARIQLFKHIILILIIRNESDKNEEEQKIKQLFFNCLSNTKLTKITIQIIKEFMLNQKIPEDKVSTLTQILNSLSKFSKKQLISNTKMKIQTKNKQIQSQANKKKKKQQQKTMRQDKENIIDIKSDQIDLIAQAKNFQQMISKYLSILQQNQSQKLKIIKIIQLKTENISKLQFQSIKIIQLIQSTIKYPQILVTIIQLCLLHMEIQNFIDLFNQILNKEKSEVKVQFKKWLSKIKTKRSIFLLNKIIF